MAAEVKAATYDIFLSTPSARRATGDVAKAIVAAQFLSTPSARRATALVDLDTPKSEISIHALREEGDQGVFAILPGRDHFYPRPPRGGRHSPC